MASSPDYTKPLQIFAGSSLTWHDYAWRPGQLEHLRAFARGLDPRREGVRMYGHFSVASHVADILRHYRIPSVMVPGEPPAHAIHG